MSELQIFKDLLPNQLQCKKEHICEKMLEHHNNVFLGYDKNGQVYTITRDRNGCLHVLERHFEEEKRAKYDVLYSLGNDMTLSDDPTYSTKNQDKIIRDKTTRKEIVLVPVKDKHKSGYTSIIISLGDETYSVINSNGHIQLLHNGEHIEISPIEETEILATLKKPFDVSMVDKLKMRSIGHVDDEVHHLEGLLKNIEPVHTPITQERMREWDEVEK